MANLHSLISNPSVFRQNTRSALGGTMKRSSLLASLLCAGLSLAPVDNHVIADEQTLFGYSSESSRTERQCEEKLRALPSPENLRSYMPKLSAHPHHVGSPADKDNADWIATKFKEFGLDTHIEQFDVLFPTPKERVVELVEGGPKFVAKLQEPPLPQDPSSNQQAEQLPTYNAYSIDGDVTAPLVYVNYGIPEDYEQLERLGISVQGKIVIARYYQSWRGIKPKVAAEHGAIGCLIYSDHQDPCVADILCRRAATACRADRPSGSGRMARRPRHHLSRRSWPRESSPQSEIQLGYQATLRRHRENSWIHFPR